MALLNMTMMNIFTEWKLQIKCTGSMDQIHEAIRSETAIAVSDGSFQNQTGACAWIIGVDTVANCIEGSMEMPGSPGNHSSFQNEAAG